MKKGGSMETEKGNGKIHLYCGDGKGKTTAAAGLAIRALGHGKTVVFAQFLKDGCSGELNGLKELGAVVLSGPKDTKFVFCMNEEEKEETACRNNRILQEAMETRCSLLVLDELCAALECSLIDRDLAKKAVLQRPKEQEIVITGRNPEDWMLEAADYITRMEQVRHPYEKGLQAREGIEY